MPRIYLSTVLADTTVRYPAPFGDALKGREKRKLGDAIGLTQFGVNITTLKPGAWSAQRHWHKNEDEFIYVIEGEIVLVEDGGEVILKPGDAAGWKADAGNGHCLINRTQRDARYLEVGTRLVDERVIYSDIDMILERDRNGVRYLHKSGEPYPK
jgi:uncharacterized cupin superfamily protein